MLEAIAISSSKEDCTFFEFHINSFDPTCQVQGKTQALQRVKGKVKAFDPGGCFFGLIPTDCSYKSIVHRCCQKPEIALCLISCHCVGNTVYTCILQRFWFEPHERRCLDSFPSDPPNPSFAGPSFPSPDTRMGTLSCSEKSEVHFFDLKNLQLEEGAEARVGR